LKAADPGLLTGYITASKMESKGEAIDFTETLTGEHFRCPFEARSCHQSWYARAVPERVPGYPELD
jgi:hypothetical protein